MTTTPTHPSPWRSRVGVAVVSLTVAYVAMLVAALVVWHSTHDAVASNVLAVTAVVTLFLAAGIANRADRIAHNDAEAVSDGR